MEQFNAVIANLFPSLDHTMIWLGLIRISEI